MIKIQQENMTLSFDVSLSIKEKTIPLNEFTQKYIGNVINGIVSALGVEGNEYRIFIDGRRLVIFVDDTEVPLKKEFPRLIIRGTIKAMLSPLKGIAFFEDIMVVVKSLDS
jgi:hypothetical protein